MLLTISCRYESTTKSFIINLHFQGNDFSSPCLRSRVILQNELVCLKKKKPANRIVLEGRLGKSYKFHAL